MGQRDLVTSPSMGAEQAPIYWQGLALALDTSSPFTLPFWGVFGEMNLEDLDVPFSPIIMWVYVGISSVILVNLLVAMFSDTYSRIKANAELEFKYQKYVRVFQYLYVVHPVPPPFNLPFVLQGLVEMLLANLCGIRSMESRRDAGTRCKPASSDTDLHDVHGLKYMKRYLLRRKSEEAESTLGITQAIREAVSQLEIQQTEEHDLAVANFKALNESFAEAKLAVEQASARSSSDNAEDAHSLSPVQGKSNTPNETRMNDTAEMAEKIEESISSKLEAMFQAEREETLAKRIDELQSAMEDSASKLETRVSATLNEVSEQLADRFSSLLADLSFKLNQINDRNEVESEADFLLEDADGRARPSPTKRSLRMGKVRSIIRRSKHPHEPEPILKKIDDSRMGKSSDAVDVAPRSYQEPTLTSR